MKLKLISLVFLSICSTIAYAYVFNISNDGASPLTLKPTAELAKATFCGNPEVNPIQAKGSSNITCGSHYDRGDLYMYYSNSQKVGIGLDVGEHSPGNWCQKPGVEGISWNKFSASGIYCTCREDRKAQSIFIRCSDSPDQ
ncbi:hypothetical protein CbuD7D7780_07750 [Coxiella burnetii]|uniref:Uncharacterized protein n=1 Tax=Coxiella burnetii (strain Dugway 5J108-111) TaxID=434922 RepID=A9KCP9_COXBN|nr:hypothetical protein [Coxiella burnetii]ABS76772.2 hypothetical protein CBUD_1501 [Coxiella burnetii Dugway 5J108-111]OYK79804.1 hypothetical protein CbuD7E6568_07730 [Coxiella burnetii]OYK81886.1 hypothetical protein CbuD7D7780_07750 [Coxiella burnetii]